MSNDTITILHSHANRLLQVHQTLEMVADFLANGLDRGSAFIDLESRLIGTMRNLSKSMNVFMSDVGENWRERGMPAELYRDLKRLEGDLNSTDLAAGTLGVGYRTATVLVDAQACLTGLNRFSGKRVKKEWLRALWRDLRDLLHLGRAMDALHCLSVVKDLELQTRAVMEVMGANFQREEDGVLDAAEIFDTACASQYKFAFERGIELRRRIDSPAVLYGKRRDLVRALSNIINNAVKYSYLMRNGRAWVDLGLELNGNEARFWVESWGVPIPEDEIVNGTIFRLGVRGSLAGRSGFGGHGIGLADAWRVAEGHGGRLLVESRPADHSDLDPDYSKPFITRVILMIPGSPG